MEDKIDEQIESLEEENKEKELDNDKTKVFGEIKEEVTEEKQEETKEEVEQKEEEKEEVVEETKVEVKEEKIPEKKSKKYDLLIWIFALIAVIVTIDLIILLLPSLNKKEEKKPLTEDEKKSIIVEYGKKLENAIDTYYQQYDLLLTYEDATKMVEYDYRIECSEHRVYKDGKVYIADCSIDRVDVDYTYGELKEEEEEEVDYQEDLVKVYVSKDTHIATLDEPSNIKNYDVYEIDIGDRYTNLGLLGETSDYVYYHTDDNNNHLYNYKIKKEFKPTSNTSNVLPIAVGDKYDLEYVVTFEKVVHKLDNGGSYSSSKSFIYNIKNNKKIFDSDTYCSFGSPKVASSTNTYLVLDVLALEDGKIMVNCHDNGVIDYKTGKEIIPTKYHSLIIKGDYLLADAGDYQKNVYQIFDKNGKEYLNDKYDKIYVMYSKDYILVSDKNEAKIVNIDGEEIYNFENNWGVTLNYNSFTDGDYIKFEFDRDYDYSLNASRCVQYSYNTVTKEGSIATVECRNKYVS